MRVHPGVLTEAIFYARNDSDRPIVGQAVPSVAPSAASIFFNKTECFCFTEQLLAPGEERAMPVRFVIDPALPAKMQTLTLSYTFYNNDLATQRHRQQAGTLAGSH
jgi:cytochrome c oxidase assembly protein subunit 11